jgi:hypothetical protein
MALTPQTKQYIEPGHLYSSDFEAKPSLIEETYLEGGKIVANFGHLTRWTWLSQLAFWLGIPQIILMGYWLSFLKKLNHMSMGPTPDEQISKEINQISFLGLFTIIFTAIGVYNLGLFYTEVYRFITGDISSFSILPGINALIFGPPIWMYLTLTVFPKLVPILEELYPYYISQRDLGSQLEAGPSSKVFRMLYFIPIVNWILIPFEKHLLKTRYQLLQNDWAH